MPHEASLSKVFFNNGRTPRSAPPPPHSAPLPYSPWRGSAEQRPLSAGTPGSNAGKGSPRQRENQASAANKPGTNITQTGHQFARHRAPVWAKPGTSINRHIRQLRHTWPQQRPGITGKKGRNRRPFRSMRPRIRLIFTTKHARERADTTKISGTLRCGASPMTLRTFTCGATFPSHS